MNRTCLVLCLIFSITYQYISAQDSHHISFSLSVDPPAADSFKEDGRLFIFISENQRQEPREQLWPFSTKVNNIFARNLHWAKGRSIDFSASEGFVKTCEFGFDEVPDGTYYLQVLWDQDTLGSSINTSGNLYSDVIEIELNEDTDITVGLSNIVAPPKLTDNAFVRYVEMTSDTLSAWWGRPVTLKASVLLPSSYEDSPGAKYPVRYNIAGYGGRYTRVNRLVSDRSKFGKWWFSGDAPQIITVFLDGEGPFGDCYQLDSDNNGPYGYALINELIPYIEKTYRAAGTPESRFLDGCSTGGWVSLALQIYYPDIFNGTFSYSPDAVEFEDYQTINIYEDENAFFNKWGNDRPVMRNLSGDPMIVMKTFIEYENVLGRNDSYTTSGGQFSAHTALYGPRGTDGYPTPLFDPKTGEIDHTVAEHWKKYDLLIALRDNWEMLGPKLQGKIWIWMGDMDNFLLNPATRKLDEFLEKTSNPKSDAVITFEPMRGHCSAYSDREVLEMIAEKIK